MSDPVVDVMPPGPSAIEHALSILDGERLALFSPRSLLALADPQAVPAAFLPALAAQLSVEEEWGLAVTEQQQRDLLSAAYWLNARKGTPFALKRGLAAIGFPGATLAERFPVLAHDGAILQRNGRERYDGALRWALFDVRVPLSATQALDAPNLARVLAGIATWKNARSHLRALRAVANLVVVREPDAVATTRAHVGLHLAAMRDTPRDGRTRRQPAQRYLYDGVDAHGGLPTRDGVARLPAAVLRFGPQQVQPTFGVHLHLRQDRPPSLRFDSAIRRDGAFARDFNGALILPRARVVGWGGLTAAAERGAQHDGGMAYDGTRRRGQGVPLATATLAAYRRALHDGATARGAGVHFDGTRTRDGSGDRNTAPTYAGRTRIRVGPRRTGFSSGFSEGFGA